MLSHNLYVVSSEMMKLSLAISQPYTLPWLKSENEMKVNQMWLIKSLLGISWGNKCGVM